MSTLRFELARSLWPRTGGDRGHRGRLHARGPRYQRTRATSLPRAAGPWTGGGVAIDSDAALVVAHAGVVSWLAPDGRAIARCALPADISDDERVQNISPPLALDDGGVVVTTRDGAFVLDRGGVRDHWSIEGLDDSGVAPNVTHGQTLVLGSVFGTVTCIDEAGPRELGAFGYDVMAPAITGEDVLVIAGYAGAGLCGVGIDRATRWRAPLREADLAPVLDDDDRAACGSLNQHASLLVSPSGELVARLPWAARFASLPGGDWLARADRRLARIARNGDERWSVALEGEAPPWTSELVVSLEDGRVHVRDRATIAAFDIETGARVASVHGPGERGCALAPAGDGALATIEGDELVWIE